MFTADQLVAHAIGDYILQSHWMAARKTSSLLIGTTHAFFYSLPFLLLSPSFPAWLVIFATHALIDRYRVASYVVAFKNRYLAPRGALETLNLAPGTGYPADTPPWLAVWLLIAADNLLHILVNAAALRWL